MRRHIENLIGFTIGGTDGEIGKVKEFYFDDEAWIIRYMIVETGSWLFSRKVLLSPQVVIKTDWDQKLFNVNLTIDQIKNSPLIDTDKPVSRQHEKDLYAYYPWGGYYWGSIGLSGMGMGMSYPLNMNHAAQKEADIAVEDKSDDDAHLRSTDKVTGYNIKATDGEIGYV